MWALLKCKAPGEGQDGSLRGGVIGEKCLGLPCQIGGVIDDTPAALRTHQWQHFGARSLVANEIEIPRVQPVIIRSLVKRAGNTDSHIIHQHIDTTTLSKQCFLNSSLYTFPCRKIGKRQTDDDAPASQIACQFVQTPLVDVEQRQMCAFSRESTRC